MTNKLDYVWAHQLPKKGIAHRSNYPVISNVSVSGTGLVTWTTDIPSTSQVNYGSSPNLGIMSSFDGTLVTSHSMQLPNLSNGSRYYLRVQSFYLDSLSVSDLYSFIFSGGSFLTMEDGTNYILLEDGTKIVLES